MIKTLMRFFGIKVAAVGVISKGNKILLTKRFKGIMEGGKWCLPGGAIHFGEKAEDAAVREIKEEIGLSTKNIKFLFYHDEFVKTLGLHAILFVFFVKAKGKIKNNWEVSESRFFSKKEIEKLEMAFTHRDIVNKFFNVRK